MFTLCGHVISLKHVYARERDSMKNIVLRKYL